MAGLKSGPVRKKTASEARFFLWRSVKEGKQGRQSIAPAMLPTCASPESKMR